MSIEKTLKNLQDDWEGAEAQEGGGFIKFDDGDYQVLLMGAKVGEAKASGRVQVTWELLFNSGKYEDKTLLKFDGLEEKTNLGWVKGVMTIVGIDIPKKLSQLPDAFEEFFDKKENKKGVPINISIVTKDKFQNVYINSLVEDADTGGKDDKDEKDKKDKGKDKGPDLDEMTFKELKKHVKDNNIDVDPTDFDNTEELVKAIQKKTKKKSKFDD